MSSDIPADEVTETIEDPGNADPDMALRSAQDVDDPTGRRAHAQQNPDGPPGAGREHDDNVEESADPDALVRFPRGGEAAPCALPQV